MEEWVTCTGACASNVSDSRYVCFPVITSPKSATSLLRQYSTPVREMLDVWLPLLIIVRRFGYLTSATSRDIHHCSTRAQPGTGTALKFVKLHWISSIRNHKRKTISDCIVQHRHGKSWYFESSAFRVSFTPCDGLMPLVTSQ